VADSRDTWSLVIKLREAAKFASDTRKARREIDSLGDSTEKSSKKAKKLNKETTLAGAAVRQLAVAGIIAGGALAVQLGAQGLSAAGLYAVGLIAALAPLAGLLGAIPALAVGAGQALGVMLLPLAGIKQAVGGLGAGIDAKKFALLTKPAQDFVLVLDALKPRVRSLQAAIGKGLFPGLTKGLLEAAPAINALKGPLAGTGRELGGVAAHLGVMVGSKGFLADLSSQAQFNNVQIRRLGGGGLHLVNVFRNLMVGARSLVAWMVRGVSSFAAWLDKVTAAGRASGGLERGFHSVQVTTQRVLLILWRFGVALFHIGSIGKRQLGDGILVWLLRIATATERWTSSKAGISAITRAFQSARDTLREVRDFIVGAWHALGPGAGDAIRSLVNALAPLLTNSGGVGVLALYVRALGDLGSAAGWLEQDVPGATTALSILLGLIVLNKIANIYGMAAAFVKLGGAALVAAAGTEVGAAAFWTLDGAIGALILPVALIVAGIALLAYGFYVAYQKIGWFHRAVDNVVKWVKKHAPGFGDALLWPFKQLVKFTGFVIRNLGKIKHFLGGLLGKAGDLLGKINPFAGGGIVNTHLQLVGEQGPELAALPLGTRVYNAPETATMLRAPQVASVRRSTGGSGGGFGGDTHVHSTTVLKLDGKVVAKSVSDQVARQKGRG
jgi:hypothetical protein